MDVFGAKAVHFTVKYSNTVKSQIVSAGTIYFSCSWGRVQFKAAGKFTK